jgi:nucleotide-binding universal stress UspA family protein
MPHYTRPFDQLSLDDVALVGGKTASLGEMYRALRPLGVNVPGGFAITADAYRAILDAAGLREQLRDLLEGLDKSDVKKLEERGRRARSLVRDAGVPEPIWLEIKEAYQRLCEEHGRDVDVAVRSSAAAEDFTEGGRAAIDRALALPLAQGARIEIFHVLAESIPAKVRAKVEAQAREVLADAVTRARSANGGGLEITSELVRGEAYVKIIRHARSIDAELIVIGRHGRRPVRDLFIGTTAARVVRLGDTPVLVVNSDVAKPYRRPLVATDLGDTSRHTLELGLLWRACRKAGLRQITWHVLRHSFASHLVMRNAPIKAVQELLGHATILMTMRYAHLAPEVARETVRLLVGVGREWAEQREKSAN